VRGQTCCHTQSNLDSGQVSLCRSLRFVGLSLPLISIRFNFGVERTHCFSNYQAEERTCMSDCRCQRTNYYTSYEYIQHLAPQQWKPRTFTSSPQKPLPSIVLAPTFTDIAIIVLSDCPLSSTNQLTQTERRRGLASRARFSDLMLHGRGQSHQHL
jgi:hypothetical protein